MKSNKELESYYKSVFWTNVSQYIEAKGIPWISVVGGDVTASKNMTRSPSLGRMVSIAGTLGVSLDMLLDEEGIMSRETAYEVVADDIGVPVSMLVERLNKDDKVTSLVGNFIKDYGELMRGGSAR